MTQTENRLERSDPDAYKAVILARVGDRCPLEICSATPGALEQIVGGHTVEALRQRPDGKRWSALEVVGHLVDCEWVFGQRTRAIACDDRPAIIGIDQDLWVDTLKHQDRDPDDLVANFQALRGINLETWRALGDEHDHRVGLHNERGEESLGTMRMLIAGHDLHHLAQIEAILEADS